MSSELRTIVIVGGGLAGAKAAEALRQEGFDGRVVLVASERELPYERPPLTKDYLRGESPREKAFVHAEEFYGEHGIELMRGATVAAVRVAESRVELEGGEELAYDRLLVATGAEPRRLTSAGAELDGVYYLRTFEDCDTLRGRLGPEASVVVIGAGWIGAEFAASARQLGATVTVVEPARVPLERVLGPEVGAIYRALHVEHGVQMLMETGVEALEGDAAVRRVKISDGRTIECDFVVVGIGVVPRTALAEDAGLAVDNGILVDERLASAAPNVFAAGDVANAWHPFYEHRVRVEHWANALNQGPAAARAMLGRGEPYERIPYFFSDQYDAGMEYSGYATEWDEVVFRGDPSGGEFIAFWLRDRRVLAGMNFNVWDVNEHVQKLIRSRRQFDVEALRDPDTPLESLVEEGEEGAGS